jgi:drug/metabolite transporter (DMT)-like permease
VARRRARPGTAVAWAIGALLIVEGLERAPELSPLLAVTVGVSCAAAAYGAFVAWRGLSLRDAASARSLLVLKVAAGVVVALATLARWLGLADAPVAVVLALNLLSVPVVMALAPIVSGREHERVTPPIAAGAALVVGGGLVLIVSA